MRTVCSEKGFTLIEFLVSIVILMVGLLGLLQAVNLAINHNMVNESRNEAVSLADGEMVRETSKGSTASGFNAISTTSKSYGVPRKMANGFKNFSVVKTGSQPSAFSKEVVIEVRWKHKGQNYNHATASLITLSRQ